VGKVCGHKYFFSFISRHNKSLLTLMFERLLKNMVKNSAFWLNIQTVEASQVSSQVALFNV
jgi:hypothetical protein